MIYGRENGEYDLDKSEIYKLLFDEEVSSDHARKVLTSLKKIIEKAKNDVYINKDNDQIDKELYKKNVTEILGDGTHKSERLIKMSEEQSKDPEFLLKAHGYSIDAWDLVNARSNIWNVYSKKDGIQVLYSSKIIVKPKTKFVWTKENAQKVFDNLKTHYKNKISITSNQYEKNGNVLLIPIADFHYGLLSEEYVTGNNYNLEIAEELFYYTLKDIISRVQGRKFEKVLFVIGNDFINFDNLNGTTTKGTPQDNASLWFNVVNKATQLIVNGIDMLTSIAPVDVQYVMSNHDLHTMFGIMQTLKAWYRNDDNIKIDDSPLPRKYYKIGNTLLAFSHDMKDKEALKIITSEAKKHWSSCNHIICMLAHKHQAMVYDKRGYLEIMRLPTISGWSRWTNSMGYVQTEKKNKSFIINEKYGITDELNTIILN